MVAAGFSCLVVDKRGVGASGGEYVEAPRIDLAAADVRAWIRILARQPGVRKDAIGLLGWSQAGWVAPLAASETSDVAFLVLISGPGMSPLEQNIFDKTNRVLAQDLTDEQAAQAREAVRATMTYLVTGEDREGAVAAWDAVKDEPWFTSTYTGVPYMDREVLLSDSRGVGFVEHNAYDPAPALRNLHIPVLALYGRADRIVPVGESQVALRTSIAPDARLEIHVFDGANHGLGITGDDGSVRLHPEVYPIIIAWIRSVTAAP
jgi:pimeloyl-ACP methyl ester carboxylesterase